MQPFHITCVTCRARLKVQSPGIIGQIVACPRCESMVQVTPPAGWSSPEAADGDPQASRDEAGAPPREPAASSEQLESQPRPPETAAAVPTEASSVGPPPVSPAEQAGRRVAFAAATGGTILVIALLTAVLLLRSTDDEVSEPVAALADVSASNAGEPDGKPQPPTPPAEVPDSPVPSGPPAPRSATASADPDGARPPAVERAAVLPLDRQVDAVQPASATGEVPPTRIGATGADQASVASPVAATTLDSRRMQNAILDGLPSDGGLSPTLPDPDPADADEQEIPIQVGRSAGEDGVMVRTAARESIAAPEIAAEARLAMPVAHFEADEIAVYDALQLVSDLSGLAIAFDPHAVGDPQLTLQSTVAVDVSKTTTAGTLAAVLDTLQLDFAPTGRHLQIASLDRAAIERVWDFRDFAIPTGPADHLAEMIPRVVAPSTWQPGGGKGQLSLDNRVLRVSNSAAIVARVDRLMSSVAAAVEGLPPGSSPRLVQWQGPITLTLHEMTRLQQVIRRWETQTGVIMLVDWQQLAKVDVSPDTMLACSALNRMPGEALDAILARLDLGWRSIDAGVIQITSLAALAAEVDVRCYAVGGEGRGPADWEAAIREASVWPDGSPAQVEIAPVAGTDLVLASAAAPALRRVDRALREAQRQRDGL